MTMVVFLMGMQRIPYASPWQEWKWDHIKVYNETLRRVILQAAANGVELNETLGNGTLAESPVGRRGHTINMLGADRIVIFGGRGPEKLVPHYPKSYDIEEVNGTVVVKSYQGRTIGDTDEECIRNAAIEGTLTNSSTEEEIEKALQKCGRRLLVSEAFNDIWSYNVGCARVDDHGCISEGWTNHFENTLYGGCKIITTAITTEEVCPAPTERYGHAAAVYLPSTNGTFQDVKFARMFVYGGFSQFCDDFCSDMWVWYFNTSTWEQIPDLEKDRLEPTKKGVKTGVMKEPGRRWRFATVQSLTKMFLFGGHRLWHGFHKDNSLNNHWNVYNTLFNPKGGYMNDFYYLDLIRGEWKEITKKRTCYADPGIRWEQRNDISCQDIWPPERAGARLAMSDNKIWLFGGYQTHFPYPHLKSYGSGSGTAFLSTNSGPRPYPTHPYYLNDFWEYDLKTELWREIKPEGDHFPEGRHDHIFTYAGPVLLLHGGYGSNYKFDSLWLYNISANRWREKRDYVHPLYPNNCTDDGGLDDAGQAFMWEDDDGKEKGGPRIHLSHHETLRRQHEYHPNQTGGFRVDDMNYGTDTDTWRFSKNLEPWEEGGHFHMSRFRSHDQYNISNPTVFGEPTRGYSLDGQFGRSDVPILIPQPRRQAPGWDGCRDRLDGWYDERGPRYNLQWLQPLQRSEHGGIWVKKHRLLLIFGGSSYQKYKRSPFRKRVDGYTPEAIANEGFGFRAGETYYSLTKNDMWTWHMDHCPRNCSYHGVCQFGNCICDNGYYGIDCSNISCPGDFCYYDENLEQQCTHCCSAPYQFADTDTYIPDLRKVACDHKHKGVSNGICDGFGSCQCRPPFMTRDCSVKDCPGKSENGTCNGRGWCSLEYPVSRCMCDEPFYGTECQFTRCLNNCTVPQGTCNSTTGKCTCEPTYNPYNITLMYYTHGTTDGKWPSFNATYAGEDCSYIVAFAGSGRVELNVILSVASLFLLSLCLTPMLCEG